MHPAASRIERRLLGATGLEVSAIGLGTAALAMPYGAPGGEREPPPRDEARRAVEAALEAGVALIDTAPGYGDAERLVGEAIAGQPDCLVATKLATPAGGWSSLSVAETRAAVRTSVTESLERLGRERLEIVQIHNADRELLAAGDLADALDGLRSEGLLRATGATVYAEDDALAAVESGRFDAVQVPYSPLDPSAASRVLPRAAERRVAVIARSVLLRGVLSPAAQSLPRRFAPLREAADRFRRRMGASWEELPGAALAFVLARPGVSAALVGPRSSTELRELLSGAERFAAAARELGDFDPELPAELLDPRAWERP